MQYSQEHLKTMVYAEFGGQTECIMGNWKIENEEMWLGKNGFQGTFHLLELAGQTSTSCKENSTINHDYSTGFVYS